MGGPCGLRIDLLGAESIPAAVTTCGVPDPGARSPKAGHAKSSPLAVGDHWDLRPLLPSPPSPAHGGDPGTKVLSASARGF